VPKGFEGGSDTFFSLVYTSQITLYDSLEPFLQIWPVPSSLHSGFQGRASELPNIFVEFLKGSGVPCPAIFEEAKAHFSSVVDLTTIDISYTWFSLSHVLLGSEWLSLYSS
jgi:hypothetical protein